MSGRSAKAARRDASLPAALSENGNSSLHSARRAKNDEFYTRIEDVEVELRHYREHFRGKTVYLNCDDPRWSAFWRYFCLRFGELGLEKLIATHYTGVIDPGQPSFKIEAVRGRDDTAGDGIKYVDPETGGVQTALEGDGDFRSDECVELLEQSDIVVTNPPFSLFREYVVQLVEHGKKFVILGNMNAITYKEVWPLIQGGQLWVGSAPSFMGFRVPDDSEPRPTRYWEEADGSKWRSLGNGAWFTNLDHARRHEELSLWKRYTPDEYPKYDNYDAINVDKVKDIPRDYDGVMGVPITFLDKWNPEQFEILGLDSDKADEWVGHGPSVDGRVKYRRIFVKRKA